VILTIFQNPIQYISIEWYSPPDVSVFCIPFYVSSQDFSHTTLSSPRSSAQKNLLKFDRFIHSRFAFFRFLSILEILRSRLWWWYYSSSISWTIITSKIESHDLQSHMATDDNLNQTDLGLCEPLRIKPWIVRHSMKPRSDLLNRKTLEENSIKWIWGCASIFTWKTESQDTLPIAGTPWNLGQTLQIVRHLTKTRSNEFGDVQASSHERLNRRTLPESHTALYSESLSTIAYFKVLVLHTSKTFDILFIYSFTFVIYLFF